MSSSSAPVPTRRDLRRARQRRGLLHFLPAKHTARHAALRDRFVRSWSVLASLALLITLAAAVAPSPLLPEANAGTVVTDPNNWSLQLIASPNPAQQGDTITWTVTVKNLRASGNARP